MWLETQLNIQVNLFLLVFSETHMKDSSIILDRVMVSLPIFMLDFKLSHGLDQAWNH